MQVETARGAHLLSYSTNVHPGETLDAICSMLTTDVAAVRERFAPGERFGVELRLGTAAIQSLQTSAERERLHTTLEQSDLFVFSLNGFPLGDFHQKRVKENAYRPDWLEAARQDGTRILCWVLADLLPEGITGSLSTSPGSYKPWGDARALRRELARGLAGTLHELWCIENETGKRIILAIEPEPFCTWESVREFVDFYEEDALAVTAEALVDEWEHDAAQALSIVKTYLGINLDAAHLAVEFEDPKEAVRILREAGVPMAKLHVSAAARVCDPGRNPQGMAALRVLDEPKYLHQTFAVDRTGRIAFRGEDLPAFLSLSDEVIGGFAEARTHFHMPLFGETDGALGVTSDVTEALLREVVLAGEGTHIVTETYTWPVMTDGNTNSIYDGIAGELAWTRDRLRQM